MGDQLMILIALQDLDEMILEAKDPERAKALEGMGFKPANLEALVSSRKKLAAQVDRRTLNLYERVAKRFGRAVVPVEGQICLGCFMGLPTKSIGATGRGKQDPIQICENCGRILYWL